MNVNIEESAATFRAEPAFGRPVTFEVRQRGVNVAGARSWGRKNVQTRFVVQLKDSNGDGFSHHMSFETACARALSRARRYERAYSRAPRQAVTA